MQLLPFIPEKGGAYGYIHCQKMRHVRRCEDYMMKGPLAAPATFVICVLRILRDSFVLTRTVESYLPSKSLE